MFQKLRSTKGFTLVELLIVVIILSVLAAVIIPQFGSSTADAKAASLDATLAEMRNAVERYYHDHTAVYPGEHKVDGTSPASKAECEAAFKAQLTQYTDVAGKVAVSHNAVTAKYGPYIKRAQLPKNPFSELNDIFCDIATTDITSVASEATAGGWKFYAKTGRIIANDGAHDTN